MIILTSDNLQKELATIQAEIEQLQVQLQTQTEREDLLPIRQDFGLSALLELLAQRLTYNLDCFLQHSAKVLDLLEFSDGKDILFASWQT